MLLFFFQPTQNLKISNQIRKNKTRERTVVEYGRGWPGGRRDFLRESFSSDSYAHTWNFILYATHDHEYHHIITPIIYSILLSSSCYIYVVILVFSALFYRSLVFSPTLYQLLNDKTTQKDNFLILLFWWLRNYSLKYNN